MELLNSLQCDSNSGIQAYFKRKPLKKAAIFAAVFIQFKYFLKITDLGITATF